MWVCHYVRERAYLYADMYAAVAEILIRRGRLLVQAFLQKQTIFVKFKIIKQCWNQMQLEVTEC